MSQPLVKQMTDEPRKREAMPADAFALNPEAIRELEAMFKNSQVVKESQVTKQDAGKPDYTVVLGPMRLALLEMVKVREFGNRKYAKIAQDAGVPFDPESWRKNSPQRYIASATRHLLAVIAGERANHEDGGVNHIAQAMVDLGFALELELTPKVQR